MRKTLPLILASFLLVFSLQGQTPGAGNTACDRGCLAQFLTQYLDALVSHNPKKLALSDSARFTEDTREMMGQNGAMGSLTCWEMYKVYGGSIHAVEAFRKVMPQATPSGWDAK
jgi:hypothetical protein